jgi:S-adenosylmethionine:tRNA ribosyltransferase-isomerase
MSIKHPKHVSIHDFTYVLPDERIARHPLAIRDAAKLLVYNKGSIATAQYRDLAAQLPANSLLLFTNTKVVEARLLFTKPTGASIEIFCLEPHAQYADVTTAMSQKQLVWWKCLIGGAGKWKHGQVLEKEVLHEGKSLKLQARIVERLSDCFVLAFEWTPPALSFAEVLHRFGVVPIPPYLKREAEALDTERYQTVYAVQDGSVAAPTAGLHFTDTLFASMAAKNIQQAFVTLHVGAGTFRPVKSEWMEGHEMHAEFIDVNIASIELLQQHTGDVCAVGTTSVRTLESLYWMGVKTIIDPNIAVHALHITQWEVYDHLQQHAVPVPQALASLLQYMQRQQLTRILSSTQLLIAPGYSFKVIKGLITNFHQPQSTLLLLVAALIGPDWRKVYDYALEHDFRFLSYGDGSLLIP